MIAVLRNNAGTSNWQVLHNEAIGVIGYLLGIDEYVQKALHGVSGFEFHMQNSMLDDGLWYEGSLGYHFLSLGGYETLAEVALRHGTDLYHMTVPMTNDPSRTKSFRDMYLSPVLVALPDLTLPAINDGGGTLTGNQDNYEVAYSRFPEFETQFGWALCKIIAANGGAFVSIPNIYRFLKTQSHNKNISLQAEIPQLVLVRKDASFVVHSGRTHDFQPARVDVP